MESPRFVAVKSIGQGRALSGFAVRRHRSFDKLPPMFPAT